MKSGLQTSSSSRAKWLDQELFSFEEPFLEIRFLQDERRQDLQKKERKIHIILLKASKGFSDVKLICVSPSLAGGRDEQEGLAAVRRICEEYREAKGNTANMSENTCTNTHTHTKACALGACLRMPVLEDKGQGCSSVSLRLVFTVFTRHTHLIAHLQVYLTHTPNSYRDTQGQACC